MATNNKPSPNSAPTPAPKGGSPSRLAIGTNVLVQVLLVIVIVVIVNGISFRQFKRWDFSRNQKYALAPMTKNLLGSLEKPVHAIVFFPTAQALYQDVTALLREYEYASGKKLTVEFVDPYRNLIRAKELAEKYKFGSSDNIVILDYNGKSKFVNAQDMAELDMSGAMMGQPPTVRSFKGEEALTSALLELTEEKQSKIYMVAGHGEPDVNAENLQAFKAYAGRQNLKLESVNLNNVDAVPADATGLMIFGPRTDYSEREMKLINDFWNQKKGRLFVLVNPLNKTPHLNEFLANQGITPQGDRILRTGTGLAPDESGNVALRNVIIASPAATFAPQGKDVTKDLVGIDIQLLGPTQSLNLNQAQAQIDKLKLIPLLTSGEGFWGETEYVSGESGRTSPVYFDPKKDHQGPLTVAAAVEKGALEDPRVKVDSARMVVVGNAGFLLDDGLRLSDVGIDFAVNSINWLLNREQIAGIPPKPKEPVRLSLDEKKMGRLALTVLGLIPGAVAVIGFATWWQRRS
ncbi:GldG family protein [Verrucomicrobiota bacterium sgz303538]